MDERQDCAQIWVELQAGERVGVAYEEIAVREGCSYQAVQKSIAAALKKIRKFLK